MASFFENIETAPPIEVFYMNKMYHDEPAQYKVNLSVGGLLNFISEKRECLHA